MSLDNKRLTRRGWLFSAAFAGLTISDHAAPATLPVPTSLAQELTTALKKGQPLLVMVSLEGCSFCKTARENYLAPLQHQVGLNIVQLNMRSQQLVQDFQGGSLTHDQLIRRWKVKIAPTVLFFGTAGTEVAERLVGAYIPDFYSAYLDDRLQTARTAVAL